MTTGDDSELRYPIGRFVAPEEITSAQRVTWIAELESMPSTLRAAVADLDQAQLDTAYRTGGWTVRQIVHHLPDSHLNSYARFRLALTEDRPVIKLYQEAAWAELADARDGPAEVSLALLEALHQRWVFLLRCLEAPQFERTFQHPELGAFSLSRALGLYAWHGRHHVAQITGLRSRLGW